MRHRQPRQRAASFETKQNALISQKQAFIRSDNAPVANPINLKGLSSDNIDNLLNEFKNGHTQQTIELNLPQPHFGGGGHEMLTPHSKLQSNVVQAFKDKIDAKIHQQMPNKMKLRTFVRNDSSAERSEPEIIMQSLKKQISNGSRSKALVKHAKPSIKCEETKPRNLLYTVKCEEKEAKKVSIIRVSSPGSVMEEVMQNMDANLIFEDALAPTDDEPIPEQSTHTHNHGSDSDGDSDLEQEQLAMAKKQIEQFVHSYRQIDMHMRNNFDHSTMDMLAMARWNKKALLRVGEPL
ncbi:MAG: hypothetical protein GY938_27265 [Ketobacter sp.]|nr:hypothetical protein [Ketobacter sp.]